jgi:RpiB/LacA/LacB family sugar-phosphate isomerase
MKHINILLPIAGKAQRFLDAGYTLPKPLIMAKNKQIIDWAMESIDLECLGKKGYTYTLIFAVRFEHISNFAIDELLREKFGDEIEIVVVDHDTDGSVSTCMLAEDYINNKDGLLIYTPDVYFQDSFKLTEIPLNSDGHILTFKANSPAHSYIRKDSNDFVVEAREKEVISDEAAVGVYYFKRGDEFMEYATEMVECDYRTKGEFYICPLYDMMAKRECLITASQVEKMHVLGTPQELEFFTNYSSCIFGEKPIALCADHSGYELKEVAKRLLDKHHIKYIDHGCYREKDCDYSDYVIPASKDLGKDVDFIMGFCRTGQGVNILANQLPGVRGALIFDKYTAEHSIKHNCANFLSIPSKYVDEKILDSMIKILKISSFDGGRHMTRMSRTIKVRNDK